MIRLSSYRCPGALSEALGLLAGDEYQLLAGGTDLIPQLRLTGPVKILDIGKLGLDYIEDSGDIIEIGAACTHTRLASHALVKRFLPLLGEAAGLIGSRQIRNRGTIGGNIANASPCADTLPALLNYDAEIVLLSKSGQRRVRLSDFITQPYKIDRKPDEMLFCINCKKDIKSTGHSYLKLGRRQAVNISRMTISVSMQRDADGIIKGVCIAAGSVLPVASRMHAVEEMITGRKISQKLFEEAGKYAAGIMIEHSGYRWSTPYKEPVLTGMMTRALVDSASRGNNSAGNR